MYLKILTFIICVINFSHVFAEKKSTVQFLNSGQVLPENLPFSEAVIANGFLFLSGQLGNIPGTLKLVEGGIKNESLQTMQNIKAALNAHGYDMNHLVKCSVMLADIKDWQAFNAVYQTFFVDYYPARSAWATNGLALGARVEVECIAAVNQ